MSNEEKYKKVEAFLKILETEFKNSSIYDNKAFKTFIIAGSYADWKKNHHGDSAPSWKSLPDINLYVIIDGSREEHIVIATELASIYHKIASMLDFNLLLDLHPFYKSYSNVDANKFNLQLTTRVINTSNVNQYPDYCWFGWKSNYIEICSKEPGFMEKIPSSKPTRDLNWLKYMYMAFSSYNNAVHMAVLSSMFEKKEYVFDEIYRYLKEISKDGMSLAVTVKEEFNYLDIKKWKNSLPEFFEKYYGVDAKKVIEQLESYEKKYFESRISTPIEKIASEFQNLLEIIYQKGFMERKKELLDNVDDKLFTLPLWY